jgi:hypothetical protein
LVILATVPNVQANFAGTDVFIPSLGHGPGSAGAQWYACIWVHNPNASPVNVTFRLLLRDQANPSAQTYNETIPAGDTRRYDDALATLFGVTAKTFGAVRVTTPAGQPVIVNARSYNKPPGMDDQDTTGQFYAAIPASFAIGPGQKTQLLGVYQTTPQNDSEYRYNFGFVETTGNVVTVQVTAYDESGAVVGSPKSYTLAGYQASQYNITDLLPQVNTTDVRLEAAVKSGPGQVVAFGSGVSNKANDPSTFEMSFRGELLATANGLTLPFSGTTSSSGYAFSVTNSGSGDGVQGVASIAGKSGVFGLSINGYGVTGKSSNDHGVFGTTDDAGHAGVFGGNNGNGSSGCLACVQGGAVGSSTSGDGVFGVSTSGYGVHGKSTTGDGVVGESSGAAKSGVFAVNSNPNGYAGFFNGNVRVVSGAFSVEALSTGPVCSDITGKLVGCSSDAGLKRDVRDLASDLDVLDALSHLRGVTFYWDSSVEPAKNLGPRREVGMIAQEVEEVLPEVVGVGRDGYRTLDYARITAFLVEVNKTQQTEIEALLKRVAQLEDKLGTRPE